MMTADRHNNKNKKIIYIFVKKEHSSLRSDSKIQIQIVLL